jgi:prolyl 4-hydroxylase
MGADDEIRSGRLAWLPHFHNATTQALANRIAALVGIPLENAESFQVVRYGAGHQYQAHYDGYDMTTPVGASNVARGGQRIATALLYLVAPKEGGATRFPNLDVEVAPVPGRLLVFWNVGRDRLYPHPATLHAGDPVERGEKWIANLWFRERPGRSD